MESERENARGAERVKARSDSILKDKVGCEVVKRKRLGWNGIVSGGTE
jgi:hypothetical protein